MCACALGERCATRVDEEVGTRTMSAVVGCGREHARRETSEFGGKRIVKPSQAEVRLAMS